MKILEVLFLIIILFFFPRKIFSQMEQLNIPLSQSGIVTIESQSTTWVKINPDSSYDVAAIGDSLLFVITYNNGLEFFQR